MRSLDLVNEKSLIIELISNEIFSNKFLIDDYNSMQKAYLSLDNNEYSLSIYYPDKILFCSNSGFDIKNHAEQTILSKINKIVGKYESLDYLKLYIKVSSDTSSFLQVYKGNNVLWNDNDNILSVYNNNFVTTPTKHYLKPMNTKMEFPMKNRLLRMNYQILMNVIKLHIV